MIDAPGAAGTDPILDANGVELARIVRDDDGGEALETRGVAVFEIASGVDATERKLGWTLFAVMFGATAPRAQPARDPLAALRSWVGEDAGRGARVYRLATGFRIVVTSPRLEAASAEAESLRARLGAAGPRRVRLTPRAGCALCHFVETIGHPAEGAVVQLVERHDVTTRAFDRLPFD